MESDAGSHGLFSRYPDETVTLPSGRQFRVPYHCYDADAFVLHGTLDLAGAEALLAGEGCRPAILRSPGRRDRGIAQIWLNLYRDSNVGPYREVVISLAATSEKEPPIIPHRNAASLLLPMLDPGCVLFARWLYLDSQLGIDVGREVWGFPKYRADLSFDRVPSGGSGGEGLSAGTTLTHRTLTTAGKEVLRAHLVLEQTARERLEVSWQMLRAFGVRGLWGLAGGPEVAFTILTPVLLKQVVTPVLMAGRPRLYRWTARNELSFGPDTAGGRALAELRFEPVLVQVVERLKFVMLADDPRAMDPIRTPVEAG